MKKFAVIAGGRFFTDAVDGPGWTDVEVDGYYDSNGKYVPPQYSSSPALKTEAISTRSDGTVR